MHGMWAVLALLSVAGLPICAAADARYNISQGQDVGVIVPSISGVARANFFHYASKVALQLLHENFKPTPLQDTETMAFVPVVGAFRIKLTNTMLLDVAMDDSTSGLSLAPGGKMLFAAAGVKAHLTARFHYRRTNFPVIAGEGDVFITINEGNIRVLSSVVNDGTGRPHIILNTPVDVAFGSVGLHISGCRFSWLYNAVLGLVGGGLKPMIVEEVAGQLANIVPAQANEALKGVPVVVDIQGLHLNTSMDGNPLITPLQMSVQDWGRFQSPGGAWEECPYRRVAPQGAPGSNATAEGSRQEGLEGEGSHVASRKLYAQPASRQQEHSDADRAMISVLIDESIVDCFTWALWRQGKLARYLEGDEVPGNALHTATWLLAIPQLYVLHPNSLMGLQANVSVAPLTQISASKGISSNGNATLAFYLAEDPLLQQQDVHREAALRQQTQGPYAYGELRAQAEAALISSNLDLRSYGKALAAAPRHRVGKQGQHLFTLDVGGQLIASKLAVEPNPAQPGGFRLRVKMQLVRSSLWVQVASTSIGYISADHLQALASLASVLVEDKINNEILKDGIALPPVQHVQPLQPSVTLQDYMLSMNTNFRYVP